MAANSDPPFLSIYVAKVSLEACGSMSHSVSADSYAWDGVLALDVFNEAAKGIALQEIHVGSSQANLYNMEFRRKLYCILSE
jgi:hypothetical protein